MGRKLYIFGTQNFAEMAHYLFTEDSGYEVAGFTADGAYVDRDTLKGLPVIAWEELRGRITPHDADLYVAIGVSKINTLRARKVDQLLAEGWQLARYASRTARLPPGLALGPNTMIMDWVNIHPDVRIGYDTVVWSNSRIALKVAIGDHCWITSAVIGDSTTIGDYSFVGLNATIAPFVHVGRNNLIGAAAVITRSTRDDEVYRGPRSTPSRVSSLRVRDVPLIR